MSKREGDITVRSKPKKYTIQASKHELQVKKVNIGLLGKVFGDRENAPTNIAGFLLALLAIAGVIVLFLKPGISAADFWGTIAPIITLLCGYLFGKKF